MEDIIEKTIEKKSDNCKIYFLDGSKFKTHITTITIETKLNRQEVTKLALLCQVLKQGCKKYQTFKDISIKSEEMYGAFWDINIVQKGEHQLLCFTIEAIKTVELKEVIEFISSFIKEPLLENTGFKESIFTRAKEILRKKLEAEKDDKKNFAKQRALSEIGKNTPLEINQGGYLQDIKSITNENLYTYFKKITTHNKIRIFYLGDRNEKKELIKYKNIFTENNINPDNLTDKVIFNISENEKNYTSEKLESNLSKNKPNFIIENADINQVRLIMGFSCYGVSYGKKNYATMLLLNNILGGNANSFLFRKIREEKALCYEIKSYNYPLSNYIFVETGIKKESKKVVGLAVLSILERFSSNEIDYATLENSKREVIRNYKKMLDNPWAMLDFAIDEVLFGKNCGLECFVDTISKVTVYDILKLAKKIQLKVVYVLEGGEKDV